jgi:hypothetical protein
MHRRAGFKELVLISRNDFVFTIGFEGDVAVVDGALKKRYRSFSTLELAEEGMFKQAVCSAVYAGPDKQQEQLEQVLKVYNSRTENRLGSVDELMRTFGVFEVPGDVGKVMVI